LSEAVRNQHTYMRHFIDANWSEIFMELDRQGPDRTVIAASLVSRLCPWERYRARRLQDLVSFVELSEVEAVERVLVTAGVRAAALWPAVIAQPMGEGTDQLLGGSQSRSEEPPWRWTKTTFPLILESLRDERFVVHARLARALSTRALLLRL